jgi:hypothetical protein
MDEVHSRFAAEFSNRGAVAPTELVMKSARQLFAFAALCLMAHAMPPHSHGQAFERIVIDGQFPGAYQVEVADVNGDRRPDIVAVGGSTCAWYENPSWKKRVVADRAQTPGIISSATGDLTGDGKSEIAIAYEFEMNRPAQGKLALAAQCETADALWHLTPMGDVPSIHRLRWGDVDGDRRPDLVVAPIFGPSATPPRFDQDGASLRVFFFSKENGTLKWHHEQPDARFLVMHAIDVLDRNGDGRSEILSASNDGITEVTRGTGASSGAGVDWRKSPIVEGAPGVSPKRGSSEIHIGRLKGDRQFVAAIEPWHGNEVVIHLGELANAIFGERTVIDDSLADGHALWVADVDGDGDDEVFAGHRGKDHRVSMYDFDRAKQTWTKTVIDSDIAAQDLRGGDIDGDGTPDVVAVGGATHNVIWYRPKRQR